MIPEREISNTLSGQLKNSRYLYFTTNSNRTEIKIGITTDLLNFVKNSKNCPDLFLGFVENNSRLVYFEEYTDQEAAKKRFMELNRWTKTQKERLIRKYNQNWIDLSQGVIHEDYFNWGQNKGPMITPGLKPTNLN